MSNGNANERNIDFDEESDGFNAPTTNETNLPEDNKWEWKFLRGARIVIVCIVSFVIATKPCCPPEAPASNATDVPEENNNATMMNSAFYATEGPLNTTIEFLNKTVSNGYANNEELEDSFEKAVDARQYRSCFKHLAFADADGDNVLTETEYQSAIQTMTGGNIDPSNLPSSLLEAYSERSSANTGLVIVGVRPADAPFNLVSLSVFCDAIYFGILTASGLLESTASNDRCFFAMIIADTNRDDRISQNQEYSRYANEVSGKRYGYDIHFSDLPVQVQDCYTDFIQSGTTTIDVTGSKTGDNTTAEQTEFLLRFCRHTAVATLEADGPPLPEQTTTSSSTDNGNTDNTNGV